MELYFHFLICFHGVHRDRDMFTFTLRSLWSAFILPWQTSRFRSSAVRSAIPAAFSASFPPGKCWNSILNLEPHSFQFKVQIIPSTDALQLVQLRKRFLKTKKRIAF